MTFVQRLCAILGSQDSSRQLSTYFRDPRSQEEWPHSYTGRNFERIGGRGDGPVIANQFTAADLLAVECLSVSVPAEVAYLILNDNLGLALSELLARVPTSVSLADDDAADHIGNEAAVTQAWRLLKAPPGMGWVTAGKLLARKRPRLVPVYDRVVRCALGTPGSFWSSLRDALRDDGAGIHERA